MHCLTQDVQSCRVMLTTDARGNGRIAHQFTDRRAVLVRQVANMLDHAACLVCAGLRMGRAGTPATVSPDSTGFVTTAPAPTIALSATSAMMTALAPIQTFLPIVIAE